tara:strand:+ start:1257 stop:1535 length:279 start_codon:yes stop_codon:yes gene_type:complete
VVVVVHQIQLLHDLVVLVVVVIVKVVLVQEILHQYHPHKVILVEHHHQLQDPLVDLVVVELGQQVLLTVDQMVDMVEQELNYHQHSKIQNLR